MAVSFRRMIATLVAVALAGCARPAVPPVHESSGPGLWVQGPHGAQVTVPPGAWTATERLVLELPPIGATPALPAGVVSVGATYVLRPAGTRFASAVTVAIPFDRSQVPPQTRVALLALPGADATWREVPDALLHGATVVAPVREAASFVVVIPLQPLT